jgi:transcriptional regulator with XRE-family HTH domain
LASDFGKAGYFGWARFSSQEEVILEMGSARRVIPKRLPAKLHYIREALGLSQDGMVEMIKGRGAAGQMDRSYVSGWESGDREPTLEVLLRYSEIAGVWLNSILDDEVDLPNRLPCSQMSEGIRRKSGGPSKHKALARSKR